MDENLEIFYNIKAMFVEACKNPQFNAYANGAISTLLGESLNITGFNYDYNNRFFEVTIDSDALPIAVVGEIKAALSRFIYSTTIMEEIGNILNMVNNETYGKLCNMLKGEDTADLFKITNYMYSVLFMGNIPTGHLFRIMM